MVDGARLEALLGRLTQEVAAVRSACKRSDAELLAAPDALPAMKYRLIVAVETAIDAAAHVIGEEGFRSPASFADTFASLAEAGWVDDGLALRLADAARFRNLLVHGYADVDDVRVLEIARTRLDDLTALSRAIAERI